MNRILASSAVAMLCFAGLAGCGEKDAGANPSGETADSASGAPASWNAADACSILDKTVVAAALRQDVKETSLGLVHQAGTADAATSECRYLGADGSSIATLMTRWSPINDNTAETIASTRSATASAMKMFSSAPLEDIPGLGKAAFLAPAINQLNVFFDDARMIVLTVDKVPEGASGKDIAIDLAKKAGG